MPPLDRPPTPPPGTPEIQKDVKIIPVKPVEPPRESAPIVEKKQTAIGPMFGTMIIVALLLFGGLYFWGTYLNAELRDDTLPLIPGDTAE